MRFDQSLRAQWREADGEWRFTLPEGWGQGRTVFGGLAAAVAAALGLRTVGPDWALRTINAQFLRPTTAGEVTGRFALHRTGKGTSFAEVRLAQGGEATVIAQLVFVRPRDGAVRVAAAPFREARPAEAVPELPYIPNVTPEFTRHFGLRWASGGFPFTGQAAAAFTGYCRLKVPFGDAEGMLALLDAWPCPTLTTLKAPAFASTVMWTAHLMAAPGDCDGWFGFEYDTVVGAQGFHTAVGRLFAPDGALVGWTEQLVAVFA